MGIKRVPSFSKRPDFPCGLRVLLVDADCTARGKTESLLKECHYSVSCWFSSLILPITDLQQLPAILLSVAGYLLAWGHLLALTNLF